MKPIVLARIILTLAIAIQTTLAAAQSADKIPLTLTLTYKVKEGMQQQYEKVMHDLMAAAKDDPGTLVFNVYKDNNGTYCLLERYASEAAFAKHRVLSATALTGWSAVTEIQKFIAMGNISEELSNKFKAAGYEVYAPVSNLER